MADSWKLLGEDQNGNEVVEIKIPNMGPRSQTTNRRGMFVARQTLVPGSSDDTEAMDKYVADYRTGLQEAYDREKGGF